MLGHLILCKLTPRLTLKLDMCDPQWEGVPEMSAGFAKGPRLVPTHPCLCAHREEAPRLRPHLGFRSHFLLGGYLLLVIAVYFAPPLMSRESPVDSEALNSNWANGGGVPKLPPSIQEGCCVYVCRPG